MSEASQCHAPKGGVSRDSRRKVSQVSHVTFRPGDQVVVRSHKGRHGWIQHAHRDRPGMWLVGIHYKRFGDTYRWLEERHLKLID